MVADIGVHRVGEVERAWRCAASDRISPLGVKMYTSSGNRSTLTFSRNSSDGKANSSLLTRPLTQVCARACALLLACAPVFIDPVRGDAALGDQVHFLGADLHLDRRTVGAEQHRVQALVAVGLGNGDEIAEARLQAA